MRRTPRHGEALSANERLRAVLGLSPAALLQAGLPENAWRDWDRKYGPWFRRRHGLAPFFKGDVERLEAEAAPAEPWPLPPGTQD